MKIQISGRELAWKVPFKSKKLIIHVKVSCQLFCMGIFFKSVSLKTYRYQIRWNDTDNYEMIPKKWEFGIILFILDDSYQILPEL